MPSIQSKLTRHTEKQENITHNQERQLHDPEMRRWNQQIKTLNTAITNIFKKVKNKNIRKMRDTKKMQMEFIEMKNSILEVRNTRMGVRAEQTLQQRRSVNLNTLQQKPYKLKRREKNFIKYKPNNCDLCYSIKQSKIYASCSPKEKNKNMRAKGNRKNKQPEFFQNALNCNPTDPRKSGNSEQKKH